MSSVSGQKPDFVVGFNPVPMANQVALLGSRLRQGIAWLVVGAVVTGVLWWWQKANISGWYLLGLYSISLVMLGITAARLVGAQRHLGRIGAGPALEAGRQGLVLHQMDGGVVELTWPQVTAVRTAGLKVGAGPEIVVETAQGKAWSMPLSFLDALPGTIDGGVRACSAGLFGLDLSGLDSLF